MPPTRCGSACPITIFPISPSGVAQTRGFFKQEGIDAEIIRMNPNVATMALVSADVDYSDA